MRLIFIILSIFIFTSLAAGGDTPVIPADASQWVYFGHFSGGQWTERYFNRICGSTSALSPGDEVEVTSDVHIRVGPIQFGHGRWINQPISGLATTGGRYYIGEVRQVAPGFVWISVTPKNGGFLGLDECAFQQKTTNLADEATTQKVVTCYNQLAAGNQQVTIVAMRDCSGVWVTPRALLRCGLGSECPVLPDTLEGLETTKSMLAQVDLTIDSPLNLSPDTVQNVLPLLPDRTHIVACRSASESEDAFELCVAKGLADGRYGQLLNCFQSQSEASQLGCISDQINSPNLTALLGCMGGSVEANKIVECTPNQSIKADARKLQDCVNDATNAVKCFSSSLGQQGTEVAACGIKAKRSGELAKCLTLMSPEAKKIGPTVECLAGPDGKNILECAANAVDGPTADLSRCLLGSTSKSDVLACASNSNADVREVQEIAACTRGSDTSACLGNLIGNRAPILTACLRTSELSDCVGSVDPKFATAYKGVECAYQASDAAGSLSCLAPMVGGDAPRLVACVAQDLGAETVSCLFPSAPEVRAFERVYKCVAGDHDVGSLIADCANGLVDGKTAQTLSCIAKSEGDNATLAGCAASAALPPDVSRLVGCAATSQGPTSFALCAAGPAMNEEWRIAAECAVSSGGQPVAFLGCTAGRLTIRELTKCFTNQSCFGPNNTIVAGLRTAFNDITKGPGKNNEVLKALDKVADLTGGDNSVINNPSQLLGGPNSMLNKPGQIWGGDSSVFNELAGGKNSDFRKAARALDPSTWRF